MLPGPVPLPSLASCSRFSRRSHWKRPSWNSTCSEEARTGRAGNENAGGALRLHLDLDNPSRVCCSAGGHQPTAHCALWDAQLSSCPPGTGGCAARGPRPSAAAGRRRGRPPAGMGSKAATRQRWLARGQGTQQVHWTHTSIDRCSSQWHAWLPTQLDTIHIAA